MKYNDSDIDRNLRQQFTNDLTRAHLRRIQLHQGRLRGITALDIELKYPISAIAGRNGAGKSTILALACCAYHNIKTGFKPPKRQNNYYTFKDFFIQHSEEVPPEGILIYYQFAYNNWKKSAKNPDSEGLKFQRRQKNNGGKWNDYADRVSRNVVFLGLERVVPHSERSQSRTYSKAFTNIPPRGWEDQVRDDVGFILNKTYDSVRFLRHSKYSLPIVTVGNATYSGFNMGAGENALFEIFSTIYACGQGALLVLDEIELGLHVQAQRKFIERLKVVCKKMHTQVICTTHSKEIFDCLPYDARFFVESIGGATKVTTGMSSELAFAKLGGPTGGELEILVEDEIAQSMLWSCLPTATRTRVSIVPIGSAPAVAKHLTAKYREGKKQGVLAIFDGDQRSLETDHLNTAKKFLEKSDNEFDDWFKKSINYLPGTVTPEVWILTEGITSCLGVLATHFQCDRQRLKEFLTEGLQQPAHKEFYKVAQNLGLSQPDFQSNYIKAVCRESAIAFTELVAHVESALSQGN